MAYCQCSPDTGSGHGEGDHGRDERGFIGAGPCKKKGCTCKKFVTKTAKPKAEQQKDKSDGAES